MWLAVVLVCGLDAFTTSCQYTNSYLVHSPFFCNDEVIPALKEDVREKVLTYPKRYKHAYVVDGYCVKVELKEE